MYIFYNLKIYTVYAGSLLTNSGICYKITIGYESDSIRNKIQQKESKQ